jgi:hypothetical protein
MKAPAIDELTAFHAFLTEKLKNGSPHPSPEQALDEWRETNPEEIDEEEVKAIQEAIDDMEAGDHGRPADEVMAELRAKYGLPSK